MSSLTGIAQFTNRFAQNIMGYEQEKKVEAERVADKQYDRTRQQQQDKNAQETHDVAYEGDKITLSQNKTKNKEFNDSTTYEQTRNKLAYLKSIGADEQQSIDVLAKSVNSNSKLPYTIEFERGQDGKIIQRQGPDGKPFYFQTIIDKETGQELGRKGTTFEEATGNYNQLQNAGAIEDEIAAAQAARAKAVQEMDDKLTLKKGEAIIDDAKDADKAQRDHIYKVDEMGIKHGYTIDELGVKHGYTIDLEGIKHANAVDLSNVNSQNRIGEYVGRSDVDAGGTPNVGGPAWGKFSALIKPESGGQQFNSRGQPLTSSAGAIGIAQVIPATAEATAKKHGIPWNANAYKTDANYNYKLGELYFADQMRTYGNDPVLAYAAYNAGPGAVNGWLGLKGSNQSKYRAIPGFANMTTAQKINAIPFAETRNYVAKIYRQSSSNTVARSVPAIPKLPKGAASNSTKQAESGVGITTKTAYNANVDKGFTKALTLAKSYGVKANATSSSQLSQASNKVKSFAGARSYEEVSSLYAEAVNLAVKAIPDRERGKLSNAQKKDIGEKMVLTMAGASSQANLLDILYRVNPSARPKAKGGSGLTPPVKASNQKPKPGGTSFEAVRARKQQEAEDAFDGVKPERPSGKTPQSSKLQALSLRGLPAIKTDPKAQKNIDYLGNLNDKMNW